MPVPITKYLCQFKCGARSMELKRATYHERICFKNPERRACTTCKHEIYEKDRTGDGGFGSREYMMRSCSKISEQEFDELFAKCEYHSEPMFHKQPVVECPYWESKK